MLGAFLVLDVLLQPSALRNWRCVIPIALVFLTTLARVQSFEAFDGTFIQLGALVAAAAAIGAAATPQGDRILGNIPLVRWFRSRSSLKSETLILVIGMGMAVTIAFVVAAFSAGLTEKYVAHELSGRPIALLRVPVLLGVCAIIMNTTINGSTRFWPAVAFAVAILALVTGFNKPNHTHKSWLTAEEMEPGLQKAISGTGSRLSRLQLYYVFSCGVDGNCQYLNELNKKISGR
jgi:hypothetical protein